MPSFTLPPAAGTQATAPAAPECVLDVFWTARPDTVQRVEAILRELAPTVLRDEPGALAFEVHRVKGDPLTFLLYERYRDEAAMQAHRESPHFKRLVLGEALALLERRDIHICEPLWPLRVAEHAKAAA